ncbi:hypothetical protein [Myroides odoratimimus]|uniref:hypothetical protein n=1 Tax=Myroides odoratimimus TaxID=76832 RepID=UPI002575A7DF|nr:hypothetical protein [Myroides odoratimimus]MDM1084907.1 hypothetical protein [Myroides odoratimimus]
MKKITLLAVLLGTTYFANAQVGIGTPDPATSAELDIVAKAGNKGILIPRVELKNTKDFQMAGKVAESTSLLVFNKTEVKDLVPTGFYYWDGAKWNRIVGKEELDTVIKNLGDNITNITTKLEGDVKNLQAVVNYILPSNPDNKDKDGKPVVTEKHTTIVYNPETKAMFYVTYENGKYTTKQIDITKMVQGVETNTFFKDIKDANGKITGYVYFNEKTIVDWLAKDKANTIDNIPNDAPGAIEIDVKGTVVNNIQEILKSKTSITEGGKTFTTVEEYLQYISQSADGNVIYKNIGTDVAPNWVFQYYDKATEDYKTISLRDLVAGTETKTFVRKTEENGKVTGFVYFSEQTIIDWLAKDKANTIDNIPNNAEGAVTVDVKGTIVNNIQEILKSKTEVKEGNKTFTTVEEYLQYITQFSEGNVIYTQIEDPKDPSKKVWVLQYWDNTANEYKTINLTDLVASVETKTNILRSETLTNGTLEDYKVVAAPVETAVKKGEIFYKYNNEDKGEQFINMTADIISSINNNEEVKNALTNVLNLGGNVYFGDHDNDATTDDVFYTMVVNADGSVSKDEIKIPASVIKKVIENSINEFKTLLGDNITNEGDIVFTGNIYNGRQVLLAKGSTKANGESARTEGVTLENATGDNAINGVLSIKVLKAGVVVTESTKDVVVSGTKIDFNIGVGNIYTALPKDTYEVVVEYLGKEVKPTTQP